MSKTILVVDDSDIIRLLAARTLKGAGYQVIEAADGKAALALLDGRSVGMAVCDWSMPVMDGIEFVKAVRHIAAYRHMPILMLTVADEDDLREKGRAAGVDAWMTKPFNPTVLVSAVDKLCR
ncbi:MAG: response regulator [Rhodoferax sp.]|nr:response regulator [Rhodoferax sp.]